MAFAPATLPRGGITTTLTMSDGWPVRAIHWPGGRRGSLLFIAGRADFIEKYAESYGVFRDWGLAVSTFDRRGQGASGRVGRDSQRDHSAGFDRLVDDMDEIVARFVREMPGPHVAVGHSMGGHLLLRHLARGRSPLDRAALLAPMLGIRPAPPGMRRLARAMTAIGLGGRFSLLQRPYGAFQQRTGRMGLLTGSAERFADEHRWLAEKPELQIGGVTWGWLAAADASFRALLAPGVLEGIATPTLTLVGADERLVDASPARRLAHGRYEIVPGGRHELLRDADGPRLDTLARLRAFLLP